MSEARALQGQFRGIPGPQRDEKLRGFARVIRHFKPASIHSSVSRADVERIVKPKSPPGLSSAYLFCFEGIMFPLAMHQAKIGEKLPIEFIFDNQDGLGENARSVYRVAREFLPANVRPLLSVDPIFRNDKDVLPLQAADMLAWYLRRQCEDGESYDFPPDHLTPDGHIHAGVNITEPFLQRIADGLAKVPNVGSLNDKKAWNSALTEAQEVLSEGSSRPVRENIANRILKRLTSLIGR